MSNYGEQSIVLIGLMGAGKTTVGRHIAARLSFPFYDSDQEIERRNGVSVSTIFEIEGENGFRQRESVVLHDLLSNPPLVLATGGGAILLEENRQVIHRAGLVAYIAVDPKCLYERTRHDRNRPLLQTENPLQTLRDLHDSRDPLYRKTASLIVDGNRYNAKQITDLIVKEFRS